MSLTRLASLLVPIAMIGCGSSHKPVEHAKPPALPGPPGAANRRAAVVTIPRGAGALAAMAPPNGLTLRNRPGGSVIAHLRPQTAWGSPTIVWAVTRRGPWLGVVATKLRNNEVGWLDIRHDRPRMWRSRLSLHASLSARTLELLRGSKVVRAMPV